MFVAAVILAIIGGILYLAFPSPKTSAKDLDRMGPLVGVGLAFGALASLPRTIGALFLILAAVLAVLGFVADSGYIPMPHITWS